MEPFLSRCVVCRFSILSLLFWLLLSGLLIPEVQAAQLGTVQSGATTITGGNASTTATITAVDPAKAFLVFSVSHDDVQPKNSQISGQLTNATTLTFQRAATTSDVTVKWYVAEFTSGVSVQRGNVAMSVATQNITLTSVNTTKSFPLVSYRANGSTYNDTNFVKAKITSSTNLEVALTKKLISGIVEWQVVEYTDASVQTGDVSFLASDSTKTATISSVDTGKSWLIYTYTQDANSGNIGEMLVRGVITDATTLTFDRNNINVGTINLTWYVVEFTDGTTVQHNSQNFSTLDTQQNVAVTSIETAWSIALGGYLMSGGKSPSTSANPGVGWFTFDLTSATNLRITRGTIGSPAATSDVGWFVIQFIGNATAVDLTSFTASRHQDGGVLLHWRTGFDVNNLGWHVYREVGGKRVQLTPGLIAGSALMFGPGIQLNAGNSYRWWDPAGRHTDRYWIEDRDLHGLRTLHGPITPVMTEKSLPAKRHSTLLSQVGRQPTSRTQARTALATQRGRHRSHMVARQVVMSSQTPQPWEPPDLPPDLVQHALSAAPALKLDIWETGWYRVTQPELVAAGLDSRVDPRRLQLFVDGQQQSITVRGEADGRFDPPDTLEFYGVGRDTPWTDTHTYWLVAGAQLGQRLPVEMSQVQETAPPASFPATVELKERSLYLAMVKNGEAENFFGAVVAEERVERSLLVHHLDLAPPGEAQLEVVLQGVTPDVHQVTVELNGQEVGILDFAGQRREVGLFPIPQGWLQPGENAVTLTPIGNPDDVSAVDRLRLTYWHTYTADHDALRFTVVGHRQVTITGFSQSDIRVVDISDPQAARQLIGDVAPQGEGYAVTVTVDGEGEHTLLAFSSAQANSPAAIEANAPSTWHHSTQGADLVMISQGAFLDSARPLKAVREAQGWQVVLVDVEDVYDEFNFGHKSPWALRDFLHHASTTWQSSPRFVLLIGDASFDPRNYLDLDDVDFVPTPFVETAFLETASDSALVDFDADGVPELAIGRLPVQTVEEAQIVVAKLVQYAQASPTGEWTREALFIADDNDIFDFASASEDVATRLSSELRVEELFLDPSGAARLRSDLLTRLNDGKLLVNYIGHGSTEVWAGGELLTSADARALTNGDRLPLVVAMTCLNGFFHDLYTESLAEALLKAEQGGAVAVWASSGLTALSGQAVMNQVLVNALFGVDTMTLGEAILQAKASVTDRDIQRTWVLFGDPTLRLKSPSTGSAPSLEDSPLGTQADSSGGGGSGGCALSPGTAFDPLLLSVLGLICIYLVWMHARSLPRRRRIEF